MRLPVRANRSSTSHAARQSKPVTIFGHSHSASDIRQAAIEQMRMEDAADDEAKETAPPFLPSPGSRTSATFGLQPASQSLTPAPQEDLGQKAQESATPARRPLQAPEEAFAQRRPSPSRGLGTEAGTQAQTAAELPLQPSSGHRLPGNAHAPEGWSAAAVSAFFQSLTFDEAAAIARENQVDGKTLLELNDEDFGSHFHLKPLQIKRVRADLKHRGAPRKTDPPSPPTPSPRLHALSCSAQDVASVSALPAQGAPQTRKASVMASQSHAASLAASVDDGRESTQPGATEGSPALKKASSPDASLFKLTSLQELKEREREQKERERARVRGIVRQVLMEQGLFESETSAAGRDVVSGSSNVGGVEDGPSSTTLTQTASAASSSTPPRAARDKRATVSQHVPLSTPPTQQLVPFKGSFTPPPAAPAPGRKEDADSHASKLGAQGHDGQRPAGMDTETAELQVQTYLAELTTGGNSEAEPTTAGTSQAVAPLSTPPARSPSLRVFFSVKAQHPGKGDGRFGETVTITRAKSPSPSFGSCDNAEDSESDTFSEQQLVTSCDTRRKKRASKFLQIKIDYQQSPAPGAGEQEAVSTGAHAAGRLTWKPTVTVLCDSREAVVMMRGEPKDNMERDLAEIRKAKAEMAARRRGNTQQHQRTVKSILKACAAEGGTLYSTV